VILHIVSRPVLGWANELLTWGVSPALSLVSRCEGVQYPIGLYECWELPEDNGRLSQPPAGGETYGARWGAGMIDGRLRVLRDFCPGRAGSRGEEL